MERHSLTLSSSRGASGEASAWARELAVREGLPEEKIDALDLCIIELVTNIVNHGYRGRPGQIRIELELGAETMLTITDSAPPFDPLSVPNPVVAKNIEEATVGGLGVHLVRTNATRCAYEHRSGSNVFTAWLN
jgi:anti-sigma regulatory factor (Ser/Thr protein kinase)